LAPERPANSLPPEVGCVLARIAHVPLCQHDVSLVPKLRLGTPGAAKRCFARASRACRAPFPNRVWERGWEFGNEVGKGKQSLRRTVPKQSLGARLGVWERGWESGSERRKRSLGASFPASASHGCNCFPAKPRMGGRF